MGLLDRHGDDNARSGYQSCSGYSLCGARQTHERYGDKTSPRGLIAAAGEQPLNTARQGTAPRRTALLRRMRSSVGRDSGGHPVHSGEWPGWLMRHSLVCPWLCGVGRLDSSCDGRGLAGLEPDRAEHPQGAVAALAVMEDLQLVKDSVGNRQLEAPTVVAAAYGQMMAAAVAVIASFRDSWWVLEVALTQAFSAHRKPESCGASPGFGSARGAGRVRRRPRPLRHC